MAITNLSLDFAYRTSQARTRTCIAFLLTLFLLIVAYASCNVSQH